MNLKVRHSNGRFASLNRLIVKTTIFIIFAIIAGFFFAAYFIGDTVKAEVPEAQIIDNTPAKIEELKASVIDRLLACESAGHSENEGIVMYDNNQAGSLKGKNVWSFGQLQWKVSTVQHYEKQRGIDLTPLQAELLALDTEKARELASYVIFETDGGIFNWQNCAVKNDLVAEVTVIKKLTK